MGVHKNPNISPQPQGEIILIFFYFWRNLLAERRGDKKTQKNINPELFFFFDGGGGFFFFRGVGPGFLLPFVQDTKRGPGRLQLARGAFPQPPKKCGFYSSVCLPAMRG